VFKLVVGGAALLAGYVVRDLGRSYGAAASAFDDRVAEDAADRAMSVAQRSNEKQRAMPLPDDCGSQGRQGAIPGWLDVPTCPSRRLT
jgi:hypothetical protein